MNSTIPSRSRAQKSAKTRARKKNPLRAAKLVAKREVRWIKIFSDGREVLNIKRPAGKEEYLLRLDLMCIRQEWLCGCGCGTYMTQIPDRPNTATFDHQDGRGMGGSRRDDRIVKDGQDYNRALAYECNMKKASKRGYETTVRRTMRTTI